MVVYYLFKSEEKHKSTLWLLKLWLKLMVATQKMLDPPLKYLLEMESWQVFIHQENTIIIMYPICYSGLE